MASRAVPKEYGQLSVEYDQLKADMQARLLRVFCDQYPSCEKHIAFTSMSTPLTMNRYINTTVRDPPNQPTPTNPRSLAQ